MSLYPVHTDISAFFDHLGMDIPVMLRAHADSKDHALPARSPIQGDIIAHVLPHTTDDLDAMVMQAHDATLIWRDVPMPMRGRLIGIFGDVIRRHKQHLADIVTLEAGKILSEARGEVQEMIDVAEYAVGLSRQIGGSIFPSELPHHHLEERWHPKGIVGIISAFNFPVAVWMWNLALSVVCGNANIWKPSEKTLISAVAAHALWDKACAEFQAETGIAVPQGVSALLIGGRDIGQDLVADTRISLISATGSCAMGQAVQAEIAKTLGRESLLELGGNNAVIITPSAPMPLTLESTLFGAMGTAGQRCTTTRRLFIHRSIIDKIWPHLVKAYRDLDVGKIGDPRNTHTLIGPLIDRDSFDRMHHALDQAKREGGDVVGGERVHYDTMPDSYYVRPAIVRMPMQSDIVREEVFAPILYVMVYDHLSEAVALNNHVPQGLSAAIFTTDLREANYFITHADCGIVNVNNGTSGAEIGGAFGGNKATGGGRESGSDSWRQYMNRSTNRINNKPMALNLAQGVAFPIPLDRDALHRDLNQDESRSS
jgi:aldehyde dehydrogenase (NAD+)